MPKAAHKVVVIGHRNPDTDSIWSARRAEPER